MRKFILKLLLLLLPILGMYVFAFFVLSKSGELLPIREVIDRQMTSSHPTIYGTAYSNRSRYYHYQGVLRRAPSVIAVGRSRVMQFRSAFFKYPASFYNTGGGIGEIWDIQPFLEAIPKEKSPQLIILCLDSFSFDPNRVYKKTPPPDADMNPFDILAHEGQKVYQDYIINHKFSLGQLSGKDPSGIDFIGLNAIVKQLGFRRDGSCLDGKTISDKLSGKDSDFQFQRSFSLIAEGVDIFGYGGYVSPEAVAELDRLLKFCKQRDIHVVAFLPPFAHQVFSKLYSIREKIAYLFALNSTLTPIFEKYGDSFHDFSDLRSVGSSDLEILDGFHASEKADLRIFLLMMERDPRLREVAADEAYLRKRLADAPNPYTVFRNDE